jgi:hypothetical protein
MPNGGKRVAFGVLGDKIAQNVLVAAVFVDGSPALVHGRPRRLRLRCPNSE